MFPRISCQGLVVLSLACCLQAAYAGEPAKVAVFTREFGSKAVVKGVGMLYAEQPALREAVAVQVYTPRDLSEQALSEIGGSRLVLLLHRPMDEREDRRLAEILTPRLEKAVKAGATVYGSSEHLFPKGYDAHRFVVDRQMDAYFQGGEAVNIKNGFLYVMTKALGVKTPYGEPVRTPLPRLAFGLYERRSYLSTGDYQRYLQAYRQARPGFDPQAPWIGIVFLGYDKEGEANLLNMVAEGLENAGFNVLPAYGYALAIYGGNYAWFQQGTAANVTADYGTLGGMSPLLDAGINYVVQPIAQPTGTVGDWSPTYFPYDTNATTPPTPAAITQLAYVQPSVVQGLFGAGLPLDGRYVIFGLGKYSTIVDKGMAQAPVYFDSTQGEDPDHAYSRFGVIFQTAGAGGAPLITARYVGSVALDYYGLKNTDQMFYQNQMINK